MRRAILGLAFFLLLATPARAGIVQDFSDFQSATNGIVRAPDGNYWVVEEFTNPGNVVRMAPNGQVLGRFAVGAGPTSIALASNGTIWVSVTGADKLARFDAAAGTQLPDVATGGQSDCGPVGLASGTGNDQRMYMTLPNPGGAGCAAPSKIAAVEFGGGGLIAANVPTNQASYDLAYLNGKLFAPEPDNGAVRRWTASNLTPDPQPISAPNGPNGIVIDGAGTIWVTQFNGNVAKFPSGQNGGSVQEFPATGGVLTNSFGITLGADGNIWASGHESKNIARITPTGTYTFYAVGGEPWEIVNGPDGDFFITDRASTRVRRFISSAPRVTPGPIAGIATTVASATGSIDSRGNETSVFVDYGPTIGYGATQTVTLPAAAGPAPVSLVLPNLTPGTLYHVRLRATNAEGSTTGADTTFTTTANPPPPPPPPDVLAARANFSWGFKGSRTALTKVTVTDLRGGETIKVTCKSKSKGCKFSSKTYKNVKKPKKGTKSLTSLFGRKRLLKTGAKIVVTVTAPGAVGSSATATIGKRKRDPKIVRKRINP